MNGLTGARRRARPVRLVLAQQLGAEIDGAWWPQTGVVARELPDLIETLHRSVGEIVDICINWSVAEAAVDLSSIVTGARWEQGVQRRNYRLMAVSGRHECVKLLVLPHMTAQALATAVMRCAAGRHIPASQRDTDIFKTADRVVCAARDESAAWVARRLQDGKGRSVIGTEQLDRERTSLVEKEIR